MYWKKYAQYYLRMWAQIQIRWSHSNFNNNLFRWLGISIILKQKVSFQSRFFTAIDNNCQTQKNGGKVDKNSFHVSYLAWSQEATIWQTSSNWAGCIIHFCTYAHFPWPQLSIIYMERVNPNSCYLPWILEWSCTLEVLLKMWIYFIHA